MPTLRSVHSLLARHRRLTATLALVTMLGVVALQVHAALPEHHHHGEKATACVASLVAIAVIVVLRKRRRTMAPLPASAAVVLPLAVAAWFGSDICRGRTRPGPLEKAVLRL